MKKNKTSDDKTLFKGQSFWIGERLIFIGSLATFLFFALLLSLTQGSDVHLNYKRFLDFFFDSVSVGTLTGLFRGDAGLLNFSGQLIMLIDMVINGLIISVISVMLVVFVRLGFDNKKSLRAELHKMHIDSKNILLFILIDFLLIWIIGTILFYLFGSRTLWEAIFNAASHILNDGVTAGTNSMIPFQQNIPILLSGAFLITIGGFGTSIRGYMYKVFLNLVGLKKWASSIPESILAPKNFLFIVMLVTLVLQIFGATTMYSFERNNSHIFAKNVTETTKTANTYYLSVAARTAGFSTIPDLSQLSDKSIFIIMFLMTIGGASGSFAGGVLKLTAFIYLFAYIISRIKGHFEIETPHKHLHFSERTAIEANFRIIGFSSVLLIIILLLFLFQPHVSGLFLLFEAISAVTNTGFTLGATNALNDISMLLLIILMIVGKVGFITTVISFFPRYQLLIEKAEHDFDELPVD